MKKNIIVLFINQVVNVGIPFLLIPYLVRTLGLSQYGVLAFTQVIGQYFVTIIDYGHSLSAPRDVSLLRNEKEHLNNHFLEVFWSRIFLLVLCMPVFILFVFVLPTFRGVELTASVFVLTLVAQALFPYWFLQGMENMVPLTQANLISKLFYVAGVFVFVRNSKDLLGVLLLQGVSACMVSIILVIYIRRYYSLKISKVSFQVILYALKKDWTIFIAQFSSVLFGGSNIFILGLFSPLVIVGQYAVAERIVRIAAQITSVVSVALYPRVTALFSSNRVKEVFDLLRKTIVLWGIVIFLGCLLLFVFAPFIVHIVQNTADLTTIAIIRILSITPLLIFVENIFAVQILLALRQDRTFLQNLLYVVLFSLIFGFLLVSKYQGLAMAYVSLCSQMLIMVLMISSAMKHVREKFKWEYQ